MQDFLKMDIFFVVTTIVVAAIGIAIVLLAVRLWKIFGHVERIADMAEAESVLVREDVSAFRSEVRKKGFKLTSFMRFLRKMTSGFTKRTREE